MSRIKAKLRLDYKSSGKGGRAFFGKKSVEQLAEELRQNKVSLMRNVPVQGIYIEDLDMSQEVYSVADEITGKTVAYAPVIITFYADSMEDAVTFAMKDEFRTVQILEPDEINLSSLNIEKLLFKINSELLKYRKNIELRIDNWK